MSQNEYLIKIICINNLATKPILKKSTTTTTKRVFLSDLD